MPIDKHLTKIAVQSILADDAKDVVQRTLGALQTRLQQHFGARMQSSVVFGSYSRGTILPRAMDARSDIDYMVVFSASEPSVQACLEQLKEFAKQSLGIAEPSHDQATLRLETQQLRFELVPATCNLFGGLQIAAPAGPHGSWLDTDPQAVHDKLTEAHRRHGGLIRPLVRVMKYWNATANYPFEPFALEQKVVGFAHAQTTPAARISDYFVHFVETLHVSWADQATKRDAVERLKAMTAQARQFQRSGLDIQAKGVMVQLLPPRPKSS
jgi:predicted nucleotidyltransferase